MMKLGVGDRVVEVTRTQGDGTGPAARADKPGEPDAPEALDLPDGPDRQLDLLAE